MDDNASQSSTPGQDTGLSKLLRYTRWVKNGFVLALLIFTVAFADRKSVYLSAIATLLFYIASSATYIVNELRDDERDRRQLEKLKSRTLGPRAVSPCYAVALLGILHQLAKATSQQGGLRTRIGPSLLEIIGGVAVAEVVALAIFKPMSSQ